MPSFKISISTIFHCSLERAFKTPFMPFTPLLGILTCGYLVFTIFWGFNDAGAIVLTESGKKVLQYTGPYMLLGALIYAIYGSRKSVLSRGGEVLKGEIFK